MSPAFTKSGEYKFGCVHLFVHTSVLQSISLSFCLCVTLLLQCNISNSLWAFATNFSLWPKEDPYWFWGLKVKVRNSYIPFVCNTFKPLGFYNDSKGQNKIEIKYQKQSFHPPPTPNQCFALNSINKYIYYCVLIYSTNIWLKRS